MAPDQVLDHLLDLTRRLRATVLQAVVDPPSKDSWPALHRAYCEQTGQPEPAAFADSVAQAVTCGHFALTIDAGRHLSTRARNWLVAQADPLLQSVLQLCFTENGSCDAGTAVGRDAAPIAQYLRSSHAAGHLSLVSPAPDACHRATCFLERLVSRYDSRSRRRQGVYYTPPDIVSYVVRSVDELLRGEFSLADGLADRTAWQDTLSSSTNDGTSAVHRPKAAFVRVLDPAMGTGAFLLEVFDHIRRWWVARHAADADETTHGRASRSVDWDGFVADVVLPRICGQELMLPAVVLAQLSMTARLGESGFRFARPGRLQFHLGNTLREPRVGGTWLVEEDRPYTVILGNPPFSGISANAYSWIRELLRGIAPDGRHVANYFHVNGRPLGERKHWLEDDYVKFLRLAHWLIECASAGVVGFVTNHGFLDNLTFRGMRQQLLQTFPRVTILDLHGNSRTGERAPTGCDDESVFAIEQGVAISLWRRPATLSAATRCDHADLWGTQSEKFRALDGSQAVTTQPLEPHPPCFFLAPRDRSRATEYARGISLPEAMPVNSTAAVTARDSFVVAFSESELRARIAVLCDDRVSDDEVRRRFFTSTRSTRYLPGDTRGWQLTEARRRLRCESDWTHAIRDCLYRPFDRRKILWTPWMIDWPRTAVMSHLLDGNNRAIVARRQVPASHPCNYVWIADAIALDGLIRSDNRGSESVFPLMLIEDQPATAQLDGLPPACDADRESGRRANFSADFLDRFSHQLQLAWNPCGQSGHVDHFTALELFHYIYALLHAPSYQQRFAAWLHADFPRVFVPVRRELFRGLSALGAQLAALHLLHTTQPANVVVDGATLGTHVRPGGPQLRNQRIYVNDTLSIGPVPNEVWEFRAGVHQVCRKWLKDRSGRELDTRDLTHYCQTLTAVREAIVCTQRIDGTIGTHGGWETAFV